MIVFVLTNIQFFGEIIMRLFIAINFDDDVKKHIIKQRETVKKFSRSGNFTNDDNIHLTIRFIGEADEEDIEYICEAMREACSNFRSFKINIGGLGFFPRGDKSIVWTGVEKSKAIEALYMRLERSLGKQGFGRNRQGLSPHITLGREVVLRKSYDSVKEEVGEGKVEFNVESVVLMESVRKGPKLIYRPIYVQKLK